MKNIIKTILKNKKILIMITIVLLLVIILVTSCSNKEKDLNKVTYKDDVGILQNQIIDSIEISNISFSKEKNGTTLKFDLINKSNNAVYIDFIYLNIYNEKNKLIDTFELLFDNVINNGDTVNTGYLIDYDLTKASRIDFKFDNK